MHVHRKDKIQLHDPMIFRTLEPLTTRIENLSPKWIKNNEPACYETKKSHGAGFTR